MKRFAFAEGDHTFRYGAKGLGLGQCGMNPFLIQKRSHQVPEHHDAMGRLAPQLTGGDSMSHEANLLYHEILRRWKGVRLRIWHKMEPPMNTDEHRSMFICVHLWFCFLYSDLVGSTGLPSSPIF